MANYDNQFNTLKESATPDDILKIDKELGSMNKGKLIEVWGYVQGLYKLIKDPNAAWTSKASAIATLLYTISPVDAIPDILPVVGLTDDVALIMATVTFLAVELKKYIGEIDEQKQSLALQNALELENIRLENQRLLEKEKNDTKMRHQITLTSIVAVTLIAMTIIIVVFK